MVRFPSTDGTRLVQIRALEGNYPYYGEIETEPHRAAQDFRIAQKALVDEKLMLQFGIQLGDSIKVGNISFEIVGKIQKIPGQSDVGSSVAPVVYIPLEYLDETGLIQQGSIINYITYFQFQPEIDTTNRNEESINIVYQNNTLLINGIYVNGNIKIYSIIGNMIMDIDIQNFSNITIPVNLQRENLYIIRIETSDNRIFTHKIVAR